MTRPRRFALGFAVFVLALAQARLAQAGCGALCEGTIEPAVLQPALECLTIETSLNDCGCKVHFRLDNDCPGPLTFDGEELECGQAEGEACVVEQGVRGLVLHARRSGAQTWSLQVREDDGTEHQLTVSGEIKNYDDDPGCAVAAAGPSRRGHVAALWALVGAGWLLSARRRR